MCEGEPVAECESAHAEALKLTRVPVLLADKNGALNWLHFGYTFPRF